MCTRSKLEIYVQHTHSLCVYWNRFNHEQCATCAFWNVSKMPSVFVTDFHLMRLLVFIPNENRTRNAINSFRFWTCYYFLLCNWHGVRWVPAHKKCAHTLLNLETSKVTKQREKDEEKSAEARGTTRTDFLEMREKLCAVHFCFRAFCQSSNCAGNELNIGITGSIHSIHSVAYYRIVLWIRVFTNLKSRYLYRKWILQKHTNTCQSNSMTNKVTEPESKKPAKQTDTTRSQLKFNQVQIEPIKWLEIKFHFTNRAETKTTPVNQMEVCWF